jgi:hypothetical protein
MQGKFKAMFITSIARLLTHPGLHSLHEVIIDKEHLFVQFAPDTLTTAVFQASCRINDFAISRTRPALPSAESGQ